MRRLLAGILLLATISLVGVCSVIDFNHEKRFAFEQSLTPVQKTEAEKILEDFAKMPRLSLVEYKNDDGSSGTTLALVGLKDSRDFRMYFSLDSRLVPRGCNDLYGTRYIARIITPDDPAYKDKLVEFVRQE